MNVLPWDYEGKIPYSVLTIYLSQTRKGSEIKEYMFSVYDKEEKLVYLDDSEDYITKKHNSDIPVWVGMLLRDKFHVYTYGWSPDADYYCKKVCEAGVEYQVKVDIRPKDND